MCQFGPKGFLFEAARTCVGLPKVWAAVVLLTRPDFELNDQERAEVTRHLDEGKQQCQRIMEGTRHQPRFGRRCL